MENLFNRIAGTVTRAGLNYEAYDKLFGEYMAFAKRKAISHAKRNTVMLNLAAWNRNMYIFDHMVIAKEHFVEVTNQVIKWAEEEGHMVKWIDDDLTETEEPCSGDQWRQEIEAREDASPADEIEEIEKACEIEAIENGDFEGQFIPPYSSDSAPFV